MYCRLLCYRWPFRCGRKTGTLDFRYYIFDTMIVKHCFKPLAPVNINEVLCSEPRLSRVPLSLLGRPVITPRISHRNQVWEFMSGVRNYNRNTLVSEIMRKTETDLIIKCLKTSLNKVSYNVFRFVCDITLRHGLAIN